MGTKRSLIDTWIKEMERTRGVTYTPALRWSEAYQTWVYVMEEVKA